MFSPTVLALSFLVFLIGITAGLFWEKRNLAWFRYLFRGELHIVALICYGVGLVLAVPSLLFGLILGGIFAVMIVNPTAPDVFARVGDVAVTIMFFVEFLSLFLFGRFCDRKLFSLPLD